MSLVSSSAVAAKILATTTESPTNRPNGSTKFPDIKKKMMTPLAMKLLAGTYVPIDAWAMMQSILTMIIAPLVVGLAIHHFLPALAARLARWLPERNAPSLRNKAKKSQGKDAK